MFNFLAPLMDEKNKQDITGQLKVILYKNDNIPIKKLINIIKTNIFY